jgi:hypothetical protein
LLGSYIPYIKNLGTILGVVLEILSKNPYFLPNRNGGNLKLSQIWEIKTIGSPLSGRQIQIGPILD